MKLAMTDKEILLSDLSDKAKVLRFYLKDYFTEKNFSKHPNSTEKNFSKLSDLLKKISVDLDCTDRTIWSAYSDLLKKISVATEKNFSKNWVTEKNFSGIIGLDSVASRFTEKNFSKNAKNSLYYIYNNISIDIDKYNILIKEYKEEYIKEILERIEKYEIENNKKYKDYYKTIRNRIKTDHKASNHSLEVINNPDLQKIYEIIAKYSDWVVDWSFQDCKPLLDKIQESRSHRYEDVFYTFDQFMLACISNPDISKIYSLANPQKLAMNFWSLINKVRAGIQNKIQNIRPAYDLRSKKP